MLWVEPFHSCQIYMQQYHQRFFYLGASIINMSATFPGSSDPWVCDLPRDAAALMVAAARASSIVMPRLTQARCIVKGCSEINQKACMSTHLWPSEQHFYGTKSGLIRLTLHHKSSLTLYFIVHDILKIAPNTC